jgi:hypothetical protein
MSFRFSPASDERTVIAFARDRLGHGRRAVAVERNGPRYADAITGSRASRTDYSRFEQPMSASAAKAVVN